MWVLCNVIGLSAKQSGCGIAHFMGYGSDAATVADVSVSQNGVVKARHMVLVVNCGHTVNPGHIAATGKPVRNLPLKNQGFTFA